MAGGVWRVSTGQGVVVAVLDNGVNAALPELKNAVVSGGDTTGGGTDGRTDLDAGIGHGTGMAALIAGRGGGAGAVGMAPGARILPVRALDGTRASGHPEAMGRAIRFAADHGAKIINMSFGRPPESALECEPARQEAIDYALRHDVVLVAAAGNDGVNSNAKAQPAACPGVLAVGVVDRRNRPAAYTQRQPYVAVAAPGVGSLTKDGYFDRHDGGTSSAAALVSGLAALIRAQHPEMSARDVVRQITATAQDVGPKGRDDQSGAGAIVPLRALKEQVAATSPNPVFERWDRSLKTRPEPTGNAAEPAQPHRTMRLRDKVIYGALVIGGLGLITTVALAVIVARARHKHRHSVQPLVSQVRQPPDRHDLPANRFQDPSRRSP
jgi:type VII secretion-associated serine protease mycosin